MQYRARSLISSLLFMWLVTTQHQSVCAQDVVRGSPTHQAESSPEKVSDPTSIEALREKLRGDRMKPQEASRYIYSLFIICAVALLSALLLRALFMDRSSSRKLNSDDEIAKARSHAAKRNGGERRSGD